MRPLIEFLHCLQVVQESKVIKACTVMSKGLLLVPRNYLGRHSLGKQKVIFKNDIQDFFPLAFLTNAFLTRDEPKRAERGYRSV